MKGRKMNKVTFVERSTRDLDVAPVTTVRALRRILETVGHDLSDKHIMVKRGSKKVIAEPGYIIKDTDEITFDSEVETPVVVTVSHKGKNHTFTVG